MAAPTPQSMTTFRPRGKAAERSVRRSAASGTVGRHVHRTDRQGGSGMDIARATAFVQDHHRAVLVTRRADGGLQSAPILAGVDGEGRAIISTTEPSAKVRNLRRDPRATLCVMTDRFFGDWVQVEGTAEIVPLPEAMDLLIDYYRRLAGEHPDWDDYRAAMVRDRRCLIRISIDRASGG